MTHGWRKWATAKSVTGTSREATCVRGAQRYLFSRFMSATHLSLAGRAVCIGLCLYTTFIASRLRENLICTAPPQS